MSDVKWASYKASAEKAMAQGKLDHAEPLWYAAVVEAEDFNHNDKRLTDTLESLAELLFRQKKYNEAESVVRRTLEIFEETRGPEHPDVGVLCNNLGMLQHIQQKYPEAEQLYRRAMAVLTKTLGSNHPEVVNLLANYANLLFATHREAEAHHMRSCIQGIHSGRWTRSGAHAAYQAQAGAPAAAMPAASARPAAPPPPQMPPLPPMPSQIQPINMPTAQMPPPPPSKVDRLSQMSSKAQQSTTITPEDQIVLNQEQLQEKPSTQKANSGLARLVQVRRDMTTGD